MSDFGVFAVSRAIFDHPDFADEPFTEREAWLWLISEAAFKARRVRGPSGPVSLDRGELCHSVRFMADAWKWSKSRVDRFLKKLENRDMLRDTSRDGNKVYFVSNYSKFQVTAMPTRDSDGDDARDTSGTDAGQVRDTSGTNEKKGRREERSSLRSDSVHAPVDDEFAVFWAAYPKREGSNPKEPARQSYQRARRRGVTAPELLEGARQYAAKMAGEPRRYVAQAVTWLNQSRWRDEGADGHVQNPSQLPLGPADPNAWPLSFPEDVCRRAFLDDRWLIGMGPEPGYGGCKVPRDVQERWMAEKAERKGRAA
jgi:hypothetical protein